MISKGGFDAYAANVDSQGERAMERIRRFVGSLDFGGTYESRETARQMVRDYAYDVVTAYGDNAAAIAADYYDELARLAGADVPSAVLAKAANAEQIGKSVDYATRTIWDTDEGGFKTVIADQIAANVSKMVGNRVRGMANETMYQNAKRNHNRFARVTTSKKPCAFCVMLASRGFAYLSEDSALLAHGIRKYHDDCYCKAVAAFDDEGLEGYDKADEYYDMYREATKQLPDADTREMWDALSPEDQKSWKLEGQSAYSNFRTHALVTQMRDMYGLK